MRVGFFVWEYGEGIDSGSVEKKRAVSSLVGCHFVPFVDHLLRGNLEGF